MCYWWGNWDTLKETCPRLVTYFKVGTLRYLLIRNAPVWVLLEAAGIVKQCKSDWIPWWFSGKESTCQCRRCGFDPWVGKICWKRKWQTSPVFLPGKSNGQRSLVGSSPGGRQELDLTEHSTAQGWVQVRELSFLLNEWINSLEC